MRNMFQLPFELKKAIRFRKGNGKVKQIPSLFNRMSSLLEEGYTFSDSINMLLPYHVEKVEFWRGKIQENLREGANVVDILQSLAVPNQFLMPIKIAEENGEMALALKNAAMQMEFNERMRKKLINLLAYPLLLIVILTSVFIAFRKYFLPNITEIITSNTNENSSSINVSIIFLHLPDFLFIIAGIAVSISIIFSVYIKMQRTQKQINILLKIPIISYFYKLQLTRHFSSVLGGLLVAGFSLQQALAVIQEQQLNKTLSYVTTVIEKNVKYGDSLSNTVSIMAVFFPKFEDFIKHGEKSGYLGRELLIYCELLDEKLQSIIKTAIAFVQPLFFLIIGICIAVAYLSILLPMYELIEII
ncbi:competence type IV pilus assembly protein ComGB [Lysinibacillus telephonicus]|uniref:competence type IV pilus assembly protein ComGB n=1 Tax=Lysinibacillus telephonicus TaxID=1714840 RepID=UPI0039781775